VAILLAIILLFGLYRTLQKTAPEKEALIREFMKEMKKQKKK